MKVLVYEPKFVGHFLGFASKAANAAASLGCQVVVSLSRKAAGSVQADVKLQLLDHRIEVAYGFDVPVLYDKWTNARFETAALAEQIAEHRPDHVIVPSGDFVLDGLVRESGLRRQLGRLGADLILHNPRQVYPDIGRRQRLDCLWDQLAVSLAAPIALHTVDPFATSSQTAWPIGLWSSPVRPLPHFHDRFTQRPAKSDARSALNLPENARLLGSIGDLGRRKGTELLIRSFVQANPPENVLLVLFGIVARGVKELLKEHRSWVEASRILVRDEFVSEQSFRDFLFAMDGMWAGFPRHVGISSTLLHAADVACPVIASDYGCVGWLTREYGLGQTYPANPQAMTRAIEEFVGMHNWTFDERPCRLLDYHNTANFDFYLTAQLRSRLGDKERSRLGDKERSRLGDKERSRLGDKERSRLGDKEQSRLGDKELPPPRADSA